MKRATIKDISLHLGVSTSTVSRALNNHPDISDALKEQVKQVAKSLNYHPNQMAVNLRRSRSNLIALIIPEITMFFFPSVIKGVEEVVHREGFQLLVLQSQDSLEREIQNLRVCHDHSMEGVLLSLSAESLNVNHLSDLKEVGIPVVLFDKSVNQTTFDQVLINDFEVAYQAVNYLIEKGAKNIAGLFGNRNMSISQERHKGFLQALTDNGITAAKAPTLFASSLQQCQAACSALLQRHKPDAFFCMSDEVAAGLYPALNAANIRIPQDCKVIAISDGNLPYFMQPTLTHLHHSGLEVGKAAAQRLIDRIKDVVTENEVATKILTINIVELGSV